MEISGNRARAIGFEENGAGFGMFAIHWQEQKAQKMSFGA